MKKILLFIVLSIFATSCGKMLDDIAPKHAISTDMVGDSDIDKLTNGVLYTMESYAGSFWLDGDIMGENFQNGPGGSGLVDVMLMTPSTPNVLSRWQKSLTSLRQVNELIVSASDKDSESAQKALKTAYFFRAYIYFNMYIRWGVAPIMKQNTMEEVPLSDKDDVAEFIISDIEEAFSYPTTESSFYYVSDDAIKALAAKVHLWLGNDKEAAKYASEVIENHSYALAETSKELASTWIYGTSSKEIIFALANKRLDKTILLFQKLNDMDTSWEFSMDKDYRETLYADVPGMKKGDIRKPVVQTSANPERILKFPNGGEGLDQFIFNENANQTPLVLFRLSEMYLIKAEALGNTAEGHAVLLEFMKKRYESVTLPSSMNDTQWEDILLDEYNREFFAEGHRWFDVKRMGRLDKFKTLDGRDYMMYWPIPQHEIDLLKDKSLYPQNPGYAS